MTPIFAYCRVSISPVRGEMKDSGEQVTQLLFGELISVKEKHNNWLRITTILDNYEGWVDEKQITYISPDEMDVWKNDQKICTKPIVLKSSIGKLLIPSGAFISSSSPNRFSIGTNVYQSNFSFKPIALLTFAKSYLNVPYSWGGKSNYGIDCSGFTQIVFRSQGVELPRDASQQVEVGETVTRKHAKAGDVAFFTNEAGRVIHVGILLSKTKIIHASGRVKIDTLDNHGIWSEELNDYSHSLYKIKRFI